MWNSFVDSSVISGIGMRMKTDVKIETRIGTKTGLQSGRPELELGQA